MPGPSSLAYLLLLDEFVLNYWMQLLGLSVQYQQAIPFPDICTG